QAERTSQLIAGLIRYVLYERGPQPPRPKLPQGPLPDVPKTPDVPLEISDGPYMRLCLRLHPYIPKIPGVMSTFPGIHNQATVSLPIFPLGLRLRRHFL